MPETVADDAALTARFGLLATALVGRPINVAVGNGPGWTDGRVLTLCLDEDLRAQLLLQAALLRSGSLAPAMTKALVGHANLTRRYLAVEGRRALAGLEDLLPTAAIPVADRLEHGLTSSPDESLRVARSRVRIPPAPVWFGALKPRRALAQAELIGSVAPQDQDEGAMPRNLELDEDEAEEDGDEDEDVDHSSILSSLRGPFGDNALTRALRRKLGVVERGSDTGGTGDVSAGTVSKGKRRTGTGVLVAAPDDLGAEPLEFTGPRITLYPEWDERRGAYRPDWCSVVDLVPYSDELERLERQARHDGLRRALAPLGLGLQRRRGQRDGYEVDLDAAVEARVAVAAGRSPVDAIYVDNLRCRRDLGVLVLVDASGSLAEAHAEGDTLFRRQLDAAAGLIDTFAILDDRVAGYAFRSYGREVVLTRIKSFDEPFGELQLSRLGGLRPDGFTRMGAAIRHATRQLLEDRCTRYQLLVVISDAFPYDQDYESSYAEADTSKALFEARSAGIGCIGIDLCSATDPLVRDRVFGAALQATAKDIDVLAPSVRGLILQSLAAANVHRSRTSGRPRKKELIT